MLRTVESGVPQLDLVLGGGLPVGDLSLIVGAPGSGKTTLVSQIGFHAASQGRNVVFVSTLSEPAARLVKHLRTFSFWDDGALGRRFFFESLFPTGLDGIAELVEGLVSSVQSHRASILVLDGFACMRDLLPVPRERGAFVNQLAIAMAALDCTALVTSSDVPDMRSVRSQPEFTMCDSILELSQNLPGERQRRTLRAWKVRGAEPLLGVHAFGITQHGLSIYPRLSARTVLEEQPQSTARVSWGTGELDVLMTGGLPRGSSTLAAGAPGTGKTLLALQFLLDGAARGEAGLFVSFRESAAQLVHKASSFERELAGPLATGQITVLRRVPAELEADQVLHEIWQEVERTSATRLVFDSVTELERALSAPHESGTLAVFMELLRGRGVTVLFLRAVSPRVGPELDFAESALEVVAENVLLLRQVVDEGVLQRMLCILKMRDARYDPSIRQYTLDARGFHVHKLTESPSDVLQRMARLLNVRRELSTEGDAE